MKPNIVDQPAISHRRATWYGFFKGVLSVQEGQEFKTSAITPGSWFNTQFKQYYERIFCHHFNYKTLQLDHSQEEQHFRSPIIPQLRMILNQLPISRRRELRRHNTGEKYFFHVQSHFERMHTLHCVEPTKKQGLVLKHI
jgi:hypothetical protein